VAGLFPEYARAPQNLDLIGVHPLGWGASQDLKETYHYLAQRRDLTALRNPQAEARRVAEIARRDLAERGVALVASERKRLADHGTLAHGAQIMTAICAAVTALRPCLAAVIAKGGITSAQVARDGLGAASAWVVGPLLPGVAVWEIEASAGTTISYAVVPGNVGDPRTLVDVAHAFGLLT
jgi:uncharacterized protein YgbK (DUF1537 family)